MYLTETPQAGHHGEVSNLPPEFDSWLRPDEPEPEVEAPSPSSPTANAPAAPTEVTPPQRVIPIIPAPQPGSTISPPPVAGPRATVPAPGQHQPPPAIPAPAPAQPVSKPMYRPVAQQRPGPPQPAPVAPAMARPAPAPQIPTVPPAVKPPKKKRHWLRWIAIGMAAYLAAVTAVFALSVNRIDALPAASSASSSGTNVLMIGSDSRAGLTPEQQAELTTGSVEGNRTDTIMLLHIPLLGTPTLVSIPRDSWVPIPGYGYDKINAAYALGGPQLLITTIEETTGLEIDHFVEIGLAGIANTTDALGGVRLCPTQAYDDEFSGLNVEAGCQMMDGPTALAYVRMRYQDPKGDLGRIERQQEFIAATVKRALNPLTWLLPWRAFGAASAAGESLTVSQGTHVWNLARVGVALGMISVGWGESTTVPTQEGNLEVDGQLALAWDSPAARALFAELS